MTTASAQTPINRRKASQTQAALEVLLRKALQPGFDGRVGVELTVHNGMIYQTRQILERIQTARKM